MRGCRIVQQHRVDRRELARRLLNAGADVCLSAANEDHRERRLWQCLSTPEAIPARGNRCVLCRFRRGLVQRRRCRINKAVPIDATGLRGGAGAVARSHISPDEEGVAAVLRRLGEHGRSTGCSGPVAFIPSHGSRPHLKWKPPATRGGPSGHTGRTSTLAAAPLGRYVLGVHSGAETRYNEATAVRVARSSLGSQCEPGVAHAQFRSP